MAKWVEYLGITMAVIYILGGLFMLVGPFLMGFSLIPNQNLLGGLLVGYGSFRIFRYYSGLKNAKENI